MINKSLKIFTTWSSGALLYGLIEIMSRGYSHISMGILGGLCLILIGKINHRLSENFPLVFRMLISAIIITTLEYITGMIVNVWLDLGVWDYSRCFLNISGQICLPFTVAWFLLSYVAIEVDNFIRWKIFNEEKPQCRIPILIYKKS